MPLQRLIGLEWASDPGDYMNADTHELGDYQVLSTGIGKELRIWRNGTAGSGKTNIYNASMGLLWSDDTGVSLSAGWNNIPITDLSVVISQTFFLGFVASTDCIGGDIIGTPGINDGAAYGAFTAPASVAAYGDDPVNWRSGIQVWGYVPPTITDAEDENLSYDETGFVVSGSDFEAAQGDGVIQLSDSATYGDGTVITQTATAWTDGAITMSCVQGALESGTCYLWVTTDSGQRNATGYPVSFTAAPSEKTPIAEYPISEATSGQTPTHVLDKAATPLHLETAYGAVPIYSTNAAGRGLAYGSNPARELGSFSASLTSGNKLFDALEGSTAATIELVWELPDSAYGAYYIGNLFGIMSLDGEGPCEFAVWFWEESGSQYLEFSCADDGATRATMAAHYYKRRYDISGLFGDTVVIHAVWDSTAAAESDRMRVYVDGTEVTTVRSGQGDLDVPQNAGIGVEDESTYASLLSLGGIVDYAAGIGTARGNIFYSSIYDDVLSDSEISIRATSLAADNDTTVNDQPILIGIISGLPAPAANASIGIGVSVSAAASLAGITADITAGLSNAVSIAPSGAALPALTGNAYVSVGSTVAVAANLTLPCMSAVANIGVSNSISVSAVAPSVSASVSAGLSNSASISFGLPAITSSLVSRLANAVDIAFGVAAVTGSASVSIGNQVVVSISADIPGLSGSADISANAVVSVCAALPGVTASAELGLVSTVRVIPLITAPAGFETVVSKIEEILAFECEAQQVQATAAGLDPAEWAFKVYKERNTPWDQYLSGTDKTPIVNIWYDSATPDKSRSDHSIEQVHEGRFNVDCYAYATATQTDNGHTPGDEASAISAHKIARIVIGILMHGKYRYLGDGDVICDRWLSSINAMKPPADNPAVQRITGVRLTFDIDYLQSAVFGSEETIELVNINYHHEADGQTVAALRYEV